MDIIIQKLPRYVNQFLHTVYAENPSLFRCGTAAGATCVDYARPGQYDPYKVEHDAYLKFVGADVSTDQNGVTPDIMRQFFADYHVGVINMQALADHGVQTGDYEPLHLEIEAQNRQGVIQFISVADESKLVNDENGQSLHPGLHYGHCIVRLGFSDDAGYGFWFDPANPLACYDADTKTYKPVKISWDSIVNAKPNFCYAIMGPGVEVPPADFSYQHGKWPAPPAPARPVFNEDKAEQLLNAIIQECQQRDNAVKAAVAALTSYGQSNAAITQATQGLLSELAAVKE